MASTSKVEEAQRAVEAAQAALEEAQRAHDNEPSETTEANLARATRRAELARGTLAKRREQADAAAKAAQLEAEHRDARSREKAIAATDAMRESAGPRQHSDEWHTARARSEELRQQLEAAKSRAATEHTIEMTADESAEIQRSAEALRARLAALETEHAIAESGFSSAPSDEAWSRVLAIRAQREAVRRDLTIAEALHDEATRADRERELKAAAELEAQRASERRETAERDFLAFAPKLGGERAAKAIRRFMNATREYQNAIVEVGEAIADHNVSVRTAAQLARDAGRAAPTVEEVDFHRLIASLKWWASRERGTKSTGAVESMLNIVGEAIPRGFIAELFKRAEVL